MVRFPFTINRSFLKHASHPITIPREHYSRLMREGLNARSIKVVSPFGTLPGTVCYSVAGYGPYYQIRMDCGHSHDCRSRLELDECITVQMDRIDGLVQVISRVNLSKQ